MRVIFMGSPALAIPSLQALIEAGHEVCLVVTQPDKPAGRGGKLRSVPVATWAEERGLPLIKARKVRTRAFKQRLEREQADVICVVAFGRILVRQVLELTPHGCINVHASLLPKYRGAGPIQWALLNGEAETGVCTMQMSEGLDEGDVLMVRSTPIERSDTTATLGTRLGALGAGLLVETLAGLEAGTVQAVPQEHERATFAPMLSPEVGRIDWAKSAWLIDCQVRGLDPWPRARTQVGARGEGTKSEVLTVRAAQALDGVEAPDGAAPGEVIAAGPEGLDVATGAGVLRITRAQRAGKRAMEVGKLLRGWPVPVGTKLG